jgi:hypothetical protein
MIEAGILQILGDFFHPPGIAGEYHIGRPVGIVKINMI